MPGVALSKSNAMGVGVIGAGVISSQYLQNLTQYPDVEVLVVGDAVTERAARQAEAFGIGRSGSVAEVLRHDEVEVVLNLTPPQFHTAIGLDILAAGKHVWSEKPLALDRIEGRRLLAAAASAGLRTACAPDTFLGEGFQSALRLARSEQVGKAVRAFARFESRGPQIWHPDPEFLFQPGAGPLFDMGPYYLTALVQLFGSVTGVSALASSAHARRTIEKGPRAGTEFAVGVPTHVSALYEFAGGQTAEATFSFDSQFRRFQFEAMCEEGLIQLPDPNLFSSGFTYHQADAAHAVSGSDRLFGRGVGVVDLVRSIREGVTELASGALAFHVLDIMASTAEAAAEGRRVVVESAAPPVRILPAGWSPFDDASH